MRAGDFSPAPISLSGLSGVWVYGLSATLEGGSSEWLVLFARLRPTARREVLLIFDPNGTLAGMTFLPSNQLTCARFAGSG